MEGMIEKQVVIPPRNLRHCPCQPLVETAVEKALDDGNNIAGLEVNVKVCKKLECNFLLKNKVGAYRCSRFMAELRKSKRRGMKQVAGTTLHIHKDKTSGWTYRKL